MELELFQKLFLIWLFERRPDGRLRYRRALLEVPKGNGKTPLSAWVGAYRLATQPSAVIPVAAASYDQAELLFGDLRTAIAESPTLRHTMETFEGEIQVKDGPGRAYKVAAIAGTNDGQRPDTFLADEIHEWLGNKERVHLVIGNGCAKRQGSLILNTTTPGVDIESLAGKLHQYGLQVNSGEVQDDEFLFVWWGADPDAYDLTDRDQLAQAVRDANPAADLFLNVQDVMSRHRQVHINEFLRYHLAVWTTTTEAWLPQGAWDACLEQKAIPEGASVVLGFDGSFNNDATAVAVVEVSERPHVDVVELWEAPAQAEQQEWRVPVIEVEDVIRAACKRWQVLEIACDPYRWTRTYQVLEAEGLPVAEFPQSPQRMTPATQHFYEGVINKQLTHSGDARLARHVGNAVLKSDSRGMRIYKEHRNSSRRIDLAMAALMAFDRAYWHWQQASGFFGAAWRG